MIQILANDGIDESGKALLEKAGLRISTQNIPQDELKSRLNEFDGILVRSATKVRKDLMDACPNLKLIGRGGVGMDNIDVEYARSKGLAVINTPAASSLSVAELVFAHLFTGIRFLHDANRNMPVKGTTAFNELKKNYAKGTELRGKVLGIMGFGRIGREAAKIGIGLGMDILAYDLFPFAPEVLLELSGNTRVAVPVQTVSKEELLRTSDFVTLHVPLNEGDKPVIGTEELNSMKKGAGIINCARGGVIDEQALIAALDEGKLAFAGLDVFENEPTPSEAVLGHPKISLSPHIGASTVEAQERIGIELAERVIEFFNK